MLLSSIIVLTNLFGSASVDTYGARVLSYVPEGEAEVFFVSETGTGGMPICWPWFAGLGPECSRRHGIARYLSFEIVSESCSPCVAEVTLRLKSDAETRSAFPHDFVLTLSVRLTDRLTVAMTAENTGETPFSVTEAFHPYFAIGDPTKFAVDGIDAPECSLVDTAAGRVLILRCEGGTRRVWRPNAESHLSKSVSSILPDDWKRFVCVESGTFSGDAAYRLRPGEKHTIACTIRVNQLKGVGYAR